MPTDKGCILEPPKPSDALDEFMEAIDGDGKPWSYLCASLLARELAEFGAMWHGCGWSEHAILGENPFNAQSPTRLLSILRLGTGMNPNPRSGSPR